MENIGYLQRGLRRSIACIAMVAAAAPFQVWSEETSSVRSTGTIQSAPFAVQFARWAALPATLARIVYYRDAPPLSGQHAANVYLDGRFHTTLDAGSFTVFCLHPGLHAMSSYLREAPFFPGKNTTIEPLHINGGETYYLKVDEAHIGGGNTGIPVPVEASAALLALVPKQEQVQVLSRAAIVACPTVTTARVP